MNKIKNFKDLIVWQKSYELAKAVYKSTKRFPDEERFGLTSQIRRSAVSVGSNIVEGFARMGIREALSFYNIANASLEELKFQLMLSFDFGYMDEEVHAHIASLADEVGRLLRGWRNSQKQLP